jgi:tRNA dimethylallyltransferase
VTAPAIAAIVGPTASGKSDLALTLAEQLPVEIISADSRQVYRGMDIGTAKPSRAERQRVPHHLLDLVEPDEPFTAAEWVAAARTLLPQIAARGRLPLIVGGTGLYLGALIGGFDFESQPWSPVVRQRLRQELEAEGLPVLAGRLAKLAPAVAASTDLRNARRVLRALERAELGDTRVPTAQPYAGTVHVIGLQWAQDRLDARIVDRATRMFAGGLLDETQRLLQRGYATDLPSMSGHGYREAAAVLAGERTPAEAMALTSARVRQYAKRQMTWFRHEPGVTWLDAEDAALVTNATALLQPSR